MTAVPIEVKKKEKDQLISIHQLFSPVLLVFWFHTDGESKCSQDVDDLDAQVEVIQVFLKDSCMK